jgi:CHASE3 domain sensor protein
VTNEVRDRIAAEVRHQVLQDVCCIATNVMAPAEEDNVGEAAKEDEKRNCIRPLKLCTKLACAVVVMLLVILCVVLGVFLAWCIAWAR